MLQPGFEIGVSVRKKSTLQVPPMVMSQGSIKIEGQLGRDLEFREMIEKLKTDLTKKAKKKYHITIA